MKLNPLSNSRCAPATIRTLYGLMNFRGCVPVGERLCLGAGEATYVAKSRQSVGHHRSDRDFTPYKWDPRVLWIDY